LCCVVRCVKFVVNSCTVLELLYMYYTLLDG
jgi:hypothetical protein